MTNAIDTNSGLPETIKLPESRSNILGDASKEQLNCIRDAVDCRSKIRAAEIASELDPSKKQEKFDLERKFARESRFQMLKSSTFSKMHPDSVKILEKREKFETLKTSDMLFLKQKGVDLGRILLSDPTDPSKAINEQDYKNGAKFVVNFGDNLGFKTGIGLGDILPAEVTKVKINGKEGIRGNDPRPGYYTKGEKGRLLYLPVYDGYSVEIVEKKDSLTPEEKLASDQAILERFKKTRIQDMVNAMQTKGADWEKEFTLLPEDAELIEAAKIEKENIDKRKSYREKMFGGIKGKAMFLEYFGTDLKNITTEYGINPNFLCQLFEKESGFNFSAIAKGGTATGLGQITDDTWTYITWTIIPGDSRALGLLGGKKELDRFDPVDQMIASCAYLNWLKNYRNCQSWSEAAFFYHTGPGVTSEHIPKYLEKNPAIQKYYDKYSGSPLEKYQQAFAEYYNLTNFENDTSVIPDSNKSFSWENFEGYPFERSAETGTTLCSRTARFNAQLFGIIIPQGESANASQKMHEQSGDTMFKSPKDIGGEGNVADIFVESNSVHGHRAIAIRAKHDGKWYILDPYQKDHTTRPVPLQEYSRTILAAYPYKAIGPFGKLLG